MEIFFTIHTGAFFPLKEEFFERVVLGLFSIYPCRNYSIHGRILHHSRPPSTFGPAAGFELGFLAGELFASKVAEHSLRPPGDWHRESFPVAGQAFGPGIVRPKDFPMNDLLNRALNISDFERKNASYEQTRLNRENLRIQPESYRGIGLSCAWFGNGFLSSPRELGSATLSLTLDKEGDLSIELPSRNPGSPLEKAWADMAGGLLGLENKSISFTESPGRSLQEPGPSVLGRNVSIYTKLLELASNDLLRRRFRDALPISVSRSRRRSGSRSWNSQILEGSPFETISWGAGIVEVSMSTITMEVIPTRIWLIIDGGQILLPDNARASVEAAVENALDWCRRPGESRELPLMDIQFITGGNKRISRDVSTLPWLLIPPAFIQAVRQASGVAVNRIPVTPEQLRTGGMPE
jgi:CO/xanthine dehydrogenase Mo-binding subunit